MKKYKDLNDAVQATLGTDKFIELLDCNAQFLLGLSTRMNIAFIAIQIKLSESRIGRDLQPQFRF